MNSATNEHPSAGHGNGLGTDAEPAAVVAVVVALPQLFVGLELDVREHGGAGAQFPPRGHNSLVPDRPPRDVAVVLSGGGINGVLLELGFLRRLSETPLWPRVGWIYGTSAGALAGTMGALGRLDDLEDFLLAIQPGDAFRPRPVWQFPGGLHDYTLPATIAERIGSARGAGRRARTVRGRARRVRDRRGRQPRGRRGPRLRARVRLAFDSARDHGSGDPRVRGNQRPRPSDRARRTASRPTEAGFGTSRSSTRIETRRSRR